MEAEEYRKLMDKARSERNKRLGVSILSSFIGDAANIFAKKGSTPGTYDRAVARAKQPEMELQQKYMQALKEKKENAILSKLDAEEENTRTRTSKTQSEHNQFKKVTQSKSDPNNPLAVKARAEARKRGFNVPANADLNFFELASKMGMKTFLPKDYQTVTTYDERNIPSVVAWNKNDPSQSPIRVGGGKKDLITDEEGRKGYASGERVSFGSQKNAYADKIEQVDSPNRRKEIRNWIDKDFRQNKRWEDVSRQVDAVGKVQRAAKNALDNPISASAIRVFLGDVAGLKGAQSDRDIAMFEGSNDFRNWLERRFDSIATSRKITQRDYQDIMKFTNMMSRSMHKNLDVMKVAAIKRLASQAPELSQKGRRELIDMNYSKDALDSFIDKLDKPKDDSEIPGYKATDEVADKSVPEGHTFKDDEGKTYMVGKGGRIYEKV